MLHKTIIALIQLSLLVIMQSRTNQMQPLLTSCLSAVVEC